MSQDGATRLAQTPKERELAEKRHQKSADETADLIVKTHDALIARILDERIARDLVMALAAGGHFSQPRPVLPGGIISQTVGPVFR